MLDQLSVLFCGPRIIEILSIKYDFVDFLMALELSKLEICLGDHLQDFVLNLFYGVLVCLLLIILMFPYILVNFFNIGWSLVFCYASSILILFCILEHVIELIEAIFRCKK